jgi:hypothetical protein
MDRLLGRRTIIVRRTITVFYAVIEEVWSMAIWERDRKLLRPARHVDTKASREQADDRANELASKFGHRDFSAEGDGHRSYWWGRDDGIREVHRYKVLPI